MESQLIQPHGGSLVDLQVDDQQQEHLREHSLNWPSWDMTARQSIDLELLLNGSYSPLTGFMSRNDYEHVLDEMRIADGTLWPIPITLDVSEQFARELKVGDSISLRDLEGVMVAALHIAEIWRPDLKLEAEAVYGTASRKHNGVAFLLDHIHPVYLGGRVEGLQRPIHYDFLDLRFDPAEVRENFKRRGWRRVIAYQIRNPMHKAHFEMTRRAVREADANLLIHPVVGTRKRGDVHYFTRVRCYKAILPHYPQQTTALALLPLSMRLAGPREALWHAIIRKNYGCSHFLVGRDHASPSNDSNVASFYGPHDAQEMVKKHEDELGVEMVRFRTLVYVPTKDRYLAREEIVEGTPTQTLSGLELHRRLVEGREIPSWFTFPEVVAELHRAYPPRSRQGFTIFFTGLSGSGKSTIANALRVKLLQLGDRPVTLLDGDIVRRNLSSELGFSKEHRDINIRRIGFVASEITKNGGIAICAPIAPYENVRQEVREKIDPHGGFILVHVATPLEVCEKRDRKGLYAKARAGTIKEFTGISDPYEQPSTAEVVIDTTDLAPEQTAHRVLLHLVKQGYIEGDDI